MNVIRNHISYKVDTKIHSNGDIEQLLTERADSPFERVTRWIVKTRDTQVKEALEKLGFMQWTHISEAAPKENEVVLFLHGDICKENLCYGRMGDEYWIDFTEPDENHVYIDFREVEWWCQISLPNNGMEPDLKPAASSSAAN